jgi:hypothetical protein
MTALVPSHQRPSCELKVSAPVPPSGLGRSLPPPPSVPRVIGKLTAAISSLGLQLTKQPLVQARLHVDALGAGTLAAGCQLNPNLMGSADGEPKTKTGVGSFLGQLQWRIDLPRTRTTCVSSSALSPLAH